MNEHYREQVCKFDVVLSDSPDSWWCSVHECLMIQQSGEPACCSEGLSALQGPVDDISCEALSALQGDDIMLKLVYSPQSLTLDEKRSIIARLRAYDRLKGQYHD
jgi:hypothetical protein